MKTVISKANYPRPQFFREGFTDLNGQWDFAFDHENRGIAKNWQVSFPKGLKINVPFTYETKLSGIAKTDPCPVVWYSREMFVEQDADKQVILNFEGADYLSALWVNGQYAGQNTGAYHRFSFDITAYLKKGTNTLTLRCEDRLDARQVRGKQRWYEGKPWGCFYMQSTGIWKDVWAESVNAGHLNKVKITPDINSDSVRFDFDLSHEAVGGELETVISFGGKDVAKIKSAVLRNHFNLSVDLISGADNWMVAEWSVDNPKLYDVKFVLSKNGLTADTVESYFGFREIRTSGNSILLNRVPVYQKLILAQGYFPDGGITPANQDELRRDLELIKNAGYNGVRMHQKIEDERFFYWADKLGLIVWCEMPSPYEYDDKMAQEFTAQWLKIVAQNYNHPSIFVWVPFNESWGVQRVYNDKSQQSFTRGIYHLTKAYDTMRPVISNDGWEHTESDIATLHNYTEHGETLGVHYSALRDRTLANANPVHSQKQAFASGFKYSGQPVIVSEYGGIAFKTDKNEEWGYGSQETSEDAFIDRFKSLTDAVKAMPDVCGYCYTQLTDAEQEVNGLFSIDRKPKVSIEKIKAINNG